MISALSPIERAGLHVCGMFGCRDLDVGVGWANPSCTLCAELSVVGVKYSWFGCWVQWCSAVVDFYSGWLWWWCADEVVRQRGAAPARWWWWCAGEVVRQRGAGVPGRCFGLVVVFRNSRDQVGQKCAEWTFFCMLKSSLGGFCTKNVFSELWFWSICPFTHGVGPSGVGGYMKERAAVGPHSPTAASSVHSVPAMGKVLRLVPAMGRQLTA